ncbi:hypothetical protein XCR_2720 [Xanthomonas campestris pv. raphani 756C]|nr:hypothetical protein XCR_2720 [Xanthomonas campestris pv. raphani 756C]
MGSAGVGRRGVKAVGVQKKRGGDFIPHAAARFVRADTQCRHRAV